MSVENMKRLELRMSTTGVTRRGSLMMKLLSPYLILNSVTPPLTFPIPSPYKKQKCHPIKKKSLDNKQTNITYHPTDRT